MSFSRVSKRTRSCISMGTEASATDLLGSEDFIERIRGINRVDEVGTTSEKISALLALATDDANQQVRYAAISRISNFNHSDISKEDEDKVLTAARYVLSNDKESSCQAGAADAIAGLKLREGFDDLVDAFNRTSDWMLKFSIAAGLGEMGDPRAYDVLSSILEAESTDPLLIAASLGALGDLGDERAIPVVERYLDNDDSSVQERAIIAHEMLVGKEASS